MRRREFVAVLSGFGAGCLGNGDGNVNSGNGTTDETGNDGTGSDGRDVSEPMEEVTGAAERGRVVESGSGERIAGYALGGSGYVASVWDDGDADGPPTLRTAVVNDGDETSTYELASFPPYDGVAENDAGDVLYAAPTEAHDLTDGAPAFERDGGAWYLDGEYDRDAWLPETVELAPETGYVGEYALVSDDGESMDGFYGFGGDGLTGLTVSVWTEGEPGPGEPSRFDGTAFPGTDRLRGDGTTDANRLWYHEADEETATYLEPSDETVEPPATVRFRLVHRGGDAPTGNPSRWGLRKLVGDEWVEVAGSGAATAGPSLTVRPGAGLGDELRVLRDDGKGADAGDADGDAHVVERLGGGTYVYTSGFSVNGEPLAAAFEVDAPDVDVQPPEDADAEREGSTVTVTTGSRSAGAEDGAFVVERFDSSADDHETVVAEQLYNADNALRYAVAFFGSDVERVRVETDGKTARDAVVSPRGEVRTFVYDDDIYRAELV